jgi:hypothetical protein
MTVDGVTRSGTEKTAVPATSRFVPSAGTDTIEDNDVLLQLCVKEGKIRLPS